MFFRKLAALLFCCSIGIQATPLNKEQSHASIEGQTSQIQKVRWAITEWQGLTSRDGTGVYHEVVRRVFKLNHIEIQYDYLPLKRAIDYVKAGKADMTGGLDPSEDFLQPRFPINTSQETAFFRNGTFNSEQVINYLQRKSGVWLLGYIDAFPQPLREKLAGHEVSSRDIAFTMVLNNRADYYLDNQFQMNSLLQNYKGDVDLSQFSQTRLIDLPLFMSFTKSTRGNELVTLYESGIEKLMSSGELQEIYHRWNMEFPLVVEIANR